jgi:ferredoxin
VIEFDWFYLHAYPLAQLWSPGLTWLLLVAITALLTVAPWLPPSRRELPARVDLDNCNGCGRCADDCPYGAIEMRPRSDGKSYAVEAVVDPLLCVSCGICVGACPTASPFRTRSALVPGIDLPMLDAAELRDRIKTVCERGGASASRILTFCCTGNPAAEQLRKAGEKVVEVICMGQIPPSYLDYTLSRAYADGIVLTACEGGSCRFRFGLEWTGQRIDRTRDPHLRRRVDASRIAMMWRSERISEQHCQKHVDGLRAALQAAAADGDAS